MRTHHLLAVSIPLLALPLAAQDPGEHEALPRYATAEELKILEQFPQNALDAVTPPPPGQIRCVAEYEPMDGIVVGWQGTNGWKNILAQMASHITTTGDADFYVTAISASQQTVAFNTIQAAGADMSRVIFSITPLNSIWMRDYGPRYIYHEGCRAIIDHTYNVPRPADNAFNSFFTNFIGHARYELPLRHGGGNYHLDATGIGRTTRLIVNENLSFTEQQIHDIWQDYQNLSTTFYNPLPRSVDGTQHIDMWMQVIADDAVIISDWPFNVGSIQDQICDGAAASMAAEGYTVTRVPARSVGGVHYTYTNVVMCNDIVLIPTYTNTQVTQHNTPALQAWQAAAPTKTIIQINCQAIVSAAGVMHCIVMHMPEYLGGTAPTAYLIRPNGGEVLTPGSNLEITWNSDDDEGVDEVDILLSTDGGANFDQTIASSAPSSGFFVWQVPDNCTGQARVRVVARDGNGETGFDDSDANFVINGTGCSAASTSYGAGSPGQNGVPSLSSGLPVLGSSFDMDLANGFPGAPAVLLIGGTPDATPFLGGTLLVQTAASVGLAVSGTGTASLNLPAPSDTSFAGVSLFWQVWIANDPGSSFGITSTNGLDTRFGF